MAVPYTFGSATTSIPLSQLDSNFATAITLGNTAVQLGNTITSLTGVTNVSSGSSLSLGSNNTARISIASAGYVGINNTNPVGLGQLEVQAPSTGAALWVQTGGTTSSYTVADFRTGSNAPALTIFGNATSVFNSTVGVGGTTAATSGAGISFPATQSASSDANTLDDYEEGTWTVTDTSGAGLSITTGFAFYTKIGDLVYATCDITYPTTANGNNTSFTLPFAGRNYANGYVGYTNYTSNAIYLENGNNSINMNILSNTFNSVSNATFSGKRLICTFVYKIL